MHMALLCVGSSGLGQTLLAIACGGNLVVGVEEQTTDGAMFYNLEDSSYMHETFKGYSTARNSNSSPSCQVVTVSSKDCVISCLTFSASGHLLADCSEAKTLRVWDTHHWQLRGTREIPKRATALVFTGDDQHVLVADKTGEVWQYSLSDSTLPGTHLLGHFSMLLDMLMPSCDSHVITCDRDEKIRVSKYPNSYNIKSFCLGHKEFVSTLCLCKQYPHLLVSGSGDGTIRVWQWREGKLLHTVQCPSVGEEPLVVVQLVCSHSQRPIVAVIVESLSEILLYDLSSDGCLSPCHHGNLTLTRPSDSSEPWSCAIDSLDRLWLYQSVQTEPLLCYHLTIDKVEQCTVEDNPLLSQLCKWDYFKGVKTKTRAFADLKKHTFDNMSVYLARKEERIKEQQEKKAKHELKNSPAENTQRGMDQDESHETVEPVCDNRQSSSLNSEQKVSRSNDVCVESSLVESRDFAASQPPEKKIKFADT